MKKTTLLLLFTLAFIGLKAQTTYQLNYDSIRVGKTAGTSGVALYGDIYLKNTISGLLRLNSDRKFVTTTLTESDIPSLSISKVTGLGDSLAAKANNEKLLITGSDTIDLVIDGKNARVITPSSYSYSGEPKKLAIYFHYLGGNYTTLPSANLRSALLSSGYSIATISSGNGWGNQAAQDTYIKLYNEVLKKFNFEPQVIGVAESMGNLTLHNLINKNAIPITAAISSIGVLSLKDYYAGAVSDTKASIKAAYNFTTDGEIDKATFGYDPYKRLHTTFGDTTFNSSAKIYQIVGELDSSAPLVYARKINTGLKNIYNNTILDIVTGVGHDTALVTPTIASNVIEWLTGSDYSVLSSNPDTAAYIQSNRGIRMYDFTSGSSATNIIDWYTKDRLTLRGRMGFFNGGVWGSDDFVTENDFGGIGWLITPNNGYGWGEQTTPGVIKFQMLFKNGRLLIKDDVFQLEDPVYPFEVNGGGATSIKTSGGIESGFLRATSLKTTGRIYSTSDLNYDDLLSTPGSIVMSFDPTGQQAYLTSKNYSTSTAKPLNISSSIVNSDAPITVPVNPYSSGWDGSLKTTTENDVYDKIESLGLSGTSGTPTISVNANAGTGATASIAGNNINGVVTINFTGVSAANGIMATVTLGGGFSYATKCTPVLTLESSSTGVAAGTGNLITTDGTTTTWSISISPSNLSTSGTFKFNYHNGGY